MELLLWRSESLNIKYFTHKTKCYTDHISSLTIFPPFYQKHIEKHLRFKYRREKMVFQGPSLFMLEVSMVWWWSIFFHVKHQWLESLHYWPRERQNGFWRQEFNKILTSQKVIEFPINCSMFHIFLLELDLGEILILFFQTYVFYGMFLWIVFFGFVHGLFLFCHP